MVLCTGQLDSKAKSTREARLLHTIKALQLALHRAAQQAAGGPSNLKYMQAGPWIALPVRLCQG